MRNDKRINMDVVIGELAYEHGIPYITFEHLVELGRKAALVYHLEEKAKKISFDMMCTYIKMYISTPFGLRVLRELSLQ